jgi:hypothetical protein
MMKKTLILIGICAALISIPAISALSIPTTKTTNSANNIKNLKTSIVPDYDGTFFGGLGRVYKEGEEWQYEVYSYIAGVYRDRSYKILYGNIYNTNEEQIGTITMIRKKSLMIGQISNLEGKKAPIVGFIRDYDEDNFIGRLMSIFGPAPYMWGKYIPKE